MTPTDLVFSSTSIQSRTLYQQTLQADTTSVISVTNMFLCLPAELRIQIYSYIFETFQLDFRINDYLHITTLGHESFANFLALTRVSHQVRNEVVPLLVKNQTTRVRLRHVPAFLQSTLAHYIFHQGTTADILVNIEIQLGTPATSSSPLETDIAPLLRRIPKRSNIHFTLALSGIRATVTHEFKPFEDGLASLDKRVKDLNRLFQPVHLDAWKTACNTSIAQIELSEMGGMLTMAVKKGHEWPSLTELGFLEQHLDPERDLYELWRYNYVFLCGMNE